MNPNFFEILGKYGGIGGISLGVFLVVILGIIKLMKRPIGNSSRNMLKFLAILAWSIGLAGLLSWTVASKQTTNVKTKGGVAVGGKIKDSQIEVTSPAPMSETGAPTLNDTERSSSGVVSNGGVAAGGNIEGSRIKVEGKTQAK
jgi:hypothetical protein